MIDIPRKKPANGEPNIRDDDLPKDAFSFPPMMLAGIDPNDTFQRWAAATDAPTSPPIKAWLELLGSPQYTSPNSDDGTINAQRMT